MRADRLLTLILLLQARGRMTASDLAAELEVSVRTVYRDMESLSAAGVPVYAEPGPHGGCQLIDGYRFPLRPEESEVLLLLGVPDVLRELDLAGAGRRNWRAGGPPEAGLAPARSTGSQALVHLDMPPWFRSEEPVPDLRVLAEALRRRRQLELHYRRRSPADGPARIVTPLGLVNKAGIWYLVAMTKGQQTTVFRAARISWARVTTAAGARPAGFDLAGFWEQWSADFAGSRPKLAVTLRASPRARSVFPEVFGDPIRATISAAAAPDEDGWQELTLTFEHEHAAAHRLAGFGAGVEVISPPQVREMLVEAARGILARYPAAGVETAPAS